MKRNWRPRILAAVTVGCLAAAPSAAAELPSPEPTLTATGRAAIYHDDTAGARERAVHAALIRGLERYGGLRIESSTLIKKGELIGEIPEGALGARVHASIDGRVTSIDQGQIVIER